MNINPKAVYSIFEANKLTGISKRTIQYRCKRDNVKQIDNRYIITGAMLQSWVESAQVSAQGSTQSATQSATQYATDENENLITEEFTEEQYNKLQEVIENYPLKLKDIEYLTERVEDYRLQIEYLKKSLDKRDDVMERLLENLKETMINLKETNKTIHQRQFIEAREKGFDN